ncbi:MAG: hypothetical protein ACRDWT_19425 [Jatrophihabitantaceae bacterium]
MSRQRALARAEREAAAVRRAANDQARRQRESLERARRDLRALRWRRLRLWQSAPGRRRTEDRAVLATLSLVLFVVVYVLTGSIRAVLGMALILLVAGPVLVKLTSDRSRK